MDHTKYLFARAPKYIPQDWPRPIKHKQLGNAHTTNTEDRLPPLTI